MTNDEFEKLAASFYWDTGIRAPGKDAGYDTSYTREERRAAWEDWLAEGPQR